MFAAVKLGIFDGARPAGFEGAAAVAGCLRRAGAARKARWRLRQHARSDKYLRSDSPDSLTGYIHYSNEALYPMWAHLEDAVREGTPRWNQTFGVEGGIFSGFFRTDEAKRDFLNGHARIRAHQFTGRCRGVRSEPVSSLDRSGRGERSFGGGRSRAISANASAGVRSAGGGQALSRHHRRRLLQRSAARRPISTASGGFCTIGRTKRSTACWPGSTRRCRKAAAC